ncbi:MAG: type II toxin-antitoxin system YafQ family toxin [Actinobacteria bacterium]|jgi:mRNA interferase YafQ|nr:type II toxin-antitoxin system YafQ family toxin [Actinomycetota bacterium]
MLKVRYSARFKKDFKLVQKRGYEINLLEEIVSMLCDEKPLPPKYNDHPLSGNYSGFRECHITPDWLLIYKIEKDILTLSLTRTGTHSELF